MQNISFEATILNQLNTVQHSVKRSMGTAIHTKDIVGGPVDLPVKSLQLYLLTKHIQELI